MSGQSNPDNTKPETEHPAAPATTDNVSPAPEPEPKAGAAETGAAEAGTEAERELTPELRIAELESLLAEARDRHLRAHAEMENIRKRTEREKADIAKYAITNFARDMLGVSDNLERAISAVSATDEEHAGALKALLEGVQLTANELSHALERHGIRVIEALGQQFDPNFHQAVMEKEDKDVAAGAILQVFQEGYRIGDRVLRPSMVVVAKGGFKPVKQPEPTPEGADSSDSKPAGGAAAQEAPGADSDGPDQGGAGGTGAAGGQG